MNRLHPRQDMVRNLWVRNNFNANCLVDNNILFIATLRYNKYIINYNMFVTSCIVSS